MFDLCVTFSVSSQPRLGFSMMYILPTCMFSVRRRDVSRELELLIEAGVRDTVDVPIDCCLLESTSGTRQVGNAPQLYALLHHSRS